MSVVQNSLEQATTFTKHFFEKHRYCYCFKLLNTSRKPESPQDPLWKFNCSCTYQFQKSTLKSKVERFLEAYSIASTQSKYIIAEKYHSVPFPFANSQKQSCRSRKQEQEPVWMFPFVSVLQMDTISWGASPSAGWGQGRKESNQGAKGKLFHLWVESDSRCSPISAPPGCSSPDSCFGPIPLWGSKC